MIGNHDLDYGIEQLNKILTELPNTQWLCSNLLAGDKPFLDCLKPYTVIERSGIKIGVIAIVEK